MSDRLKFAGRRFAAVLAAVLAATVALLAVSAHAAQVSGKFNVTVTLLSATLRSTTGGSLGNTAFCSISPSLAFGALVTVVCATGEVVDITAPARGTSGAPVHGGAYRFTLPGSYAGGLPDFYDGYTGPGTIASWRMIQLADRDYYELLVGW